MPFSLRKVAFSQENDGRSLFHRPQILPAFTICKKSRYHQDGNSLQTPPFYVLSFLKRKYQRKQFGICWFAKQAKQASPRGAKEPPKTPLGVQGGALVPAGTGESKSFFLLLSGANNVGICKCASVCRRRREGWDMPGENSFFLRLSFGESSRRSRVRGFCAPFAYFYHL